MPQLLIKKESDYDSSRVFLTSTNLQITIVISSIIAGVNYEQGGFDEIGLVYSLHKGGEDEVLETSNRYQQSVFP